MSGAYHLTRDDDIDIGGLLNNVWERKRLILGATLAVGLGLLVVLSFVSSRYESSARVLIESRESVFTRTTEDASRQQSTDRFDQQAIGSQVEVIGSDELALQVIRKLELAKLDEFDDSGFSMFNDIMVLLGLRSGSYGASSEQVALRAFKKRLSVYTVNESRVIAIEFWSHDPKLAQSVPNTLAETFISLQKSNQLSNTEDATEWLGPEIDAMRKRLREAEAKVAEFRSNSDILVGDNNALLATQQLSEVSSELSRLRAERSSAESKVASIRAALENGSSIDVVPEVIASPLIQRLRETQVSLKAQISELSTSLLPNHPRLRALNSQVDDFENQIKSAARNILSSLENNVDLARKSEADLLKEVNRLKSEAARVGEAEVELRALEREAAAERELLQTYLRRFREAASRQNENFFPVDARIISRAVLPLESYFPKVVPFAIAGALATAILSIVFVMAGALLSGGIIRNTHPHSQAPVPERVIIPTAGRARSSNERHSEAASAEEMVFTPHHHPYDDGSDVPLDPDLPEVGNAPRLAEDGADIRPIREVENSEQSPALAIRYAAGVIADMQGARIVSTSPSGDVGSRSAWMLARALAKSGRRTVIVDLSGGGVTSMEMIGSKELDGIFNLMNGSATFDTIAYRDRASPAHVVPAGTIPAGSPPPDFDNLAKIVDAIGESYDFTVIDCGDADPAGIDIIGGPSSIVVISAIGANQSDCEALEADLNEAGYKEVIHIMPDSVDAEKEALAAA